MSQSDRWRNRIVGHGEEAPDQLLANPANWRIHPKFQQDAMSGILDEIGWIDEVTVNRRSGHVVDGHMRAALAISRREPSVPVKYVDLDDDEEAYAVATHDPIGAMAAQDREQFSALLDRVETDDARVRAMLDQLAQDCVLTIPEPSEHREPMLASECLIEIRCSRSDLEDFQPTLSEWSERSGVTVDIS